jgi:hypothetical protein
MIAKDFIGNEITVGCNVVYSDQYLRKLKIGKVLSITPKQLNIEVDNYFRKFRQFHNQVLVYNGELPSNK